MADNTTINAASVAGGDVIKTEDIGAYKIAVSKLYLGAHDVDGGPVTAANPLPVSAAAANVTSIGGSAIGLGQQTAANSLPVVLPSNQLSTLTPLSAVAVNNFPATQPISGTISALTSGTIGSANVTAIGGNGITLGQATMANSLPVAIASNQPAVSITGALSGAIPTGANTIGAVSLAANSTLKTTYGASAALTIGLASLASDTGLLQGRQSTAVSNATNRYADVLVAAKIRVGTTPTANTTIEVWAYGSLDDAPNYPDTVTGSDGPATLTSAGVKGTALAQLGVLSVDSATSNRDYIMSPRSLAAAFGGWMPKSWGVWVVHNSAQPLNSTGGNHSITYTPVNVGT